MGKSLINNQLKQIVEELGYVLININKKNNRLFVIIQDTQGYFYNVNFYNLNRGKLPRKFCKQNEFTIYNIKLWCKLNTKNYELISDKYIDDNNKLIFKDEYGYFYFVKFSSFQNYSPRNTLFWQRKNSHAET